MFLNFDRISIGFGGLGGFSTFGGAAAFAAFFSDFSGLPPQALGKGIITMGADEVEGAGSSSSAGEAGGGMSWLVEGPSISSPSSSSSSSSSSSCSSASLFIPASSLGGSGGGKSACCTWTATRSGLIRDFLVLVPFRTSQITHLKASGLFLYVHTEQSQKKSSGCLA